MWSPDSVQCKPGYLFVLPWEIHHPGGVNQVVANLYTEVARENRYRPLLLIASWKDELPREEEVAGRCHVYYRLRSPWNSKYPLLGALRFALSLPRLIVSLGRLLAKHRVSVVNVHYPTLQAFPIAVLKRLGLYKGKLILSFHGTDLHQARATGGANLYLKQLFQTADAIVACSEGLAREARECIPGCAHRIKPVQNGLDLERLLEGQERDFALPSELQAGGFILNIARFEPVKGQDILLRAFQEVSRRYPNLNLVMIGASGPAKEPLSGLIRELGLESRVFVYEDLPHTRICAFLRNAMIFALPSREEAFGIVLLEAGAMNVPVIASRVGGIPEIIVDGESGLLVRPEDPWELAEKILDLIMNPERRKSLAARLHKRVIEHFTWKRAYREYVRIIG